MKYSDNSPFYDFVLHFGNFVVAMVIIFMFVTGSFKMQFSSVIGLSNCPIT